MLVDCQVRHLADVPGNNDFLFPSTNSTSHCSGWAATNECCRSAGITVNITATNQRGRMSTLYAALDVPYRNRELFYQHIGHSAAVNEGTYQRPPAVQALAKVGHFLATVDSCEQFLIAPFNF